MKDTENSLDLIVKELSDLKDHIININNNNDILELFIKNESIIIVLLFLKNYESLSYKQLSDITAVDYFNLRDVRFEVVYHLLSYTHNKRIRLKVITNDKVLSISEVFQNASWYEREVFDMYGITFEGLKDHRRILTDYDFEGYPLRKDFPHEGTYEVEYDEEKESIIRT